MVDREFEIPLQSINPNVYVPYWDSTVGDSPDANRYDSVILSDVISEKLLESKISTVVNNSRALFPVNDNPRNISDGWWESPKDFLRGPSKKNPSPYTIHFSSQKNSLPMNADFLPV